jgi:hypothetical protein
MKWIGQHIYDLIARFRSDVYLEDISSGTIASGGNLGLDSNNKIVKATISSGSGDITGVSITTDSGGGSKAEDTGGSADFSILGTSGIGVTNSGTTITATSVPGEIDHDSLLNFAANEHFTQANITTVGTVSSGTWQGTAIASAYLDSDTAHLTGTQTFTGEKTFSGDTTFSCDTITFESANADDPNVIIKNTTNDNQAARLQFWKNRTDAQADNDRVAEIEFFGEDASGNTQGYGKIMCQALESDHGVETGKLRLQVAEYDGTLTDGLQLHGQDANGEVDVTLGAGAASTTTVAGTLTMGSTAAMTNAGLLSVVNQSNITGLGTISSGTWQGTAIATAYIADDAVTEDKLANTLLAEIDANTAKNTNRAYFEFKGYGSSDGTNYEMPEIISDTNAPFEHNTSTGSDGLTAQATTIVMRQGGIVMPYTGTLKKFTGWVTTQGTGTVDVGIFKFTPVDNNAGNVTPVLLVNEQITGAGNTKMRSFSETSSFDAGFTAGDIIYSAVLGSGSSKSWYLNSMLEVEWS